MDIGVIIPTVPPRLSMLDRAMESVYNQILEPAQIVAVCDVKGEGASIIRNRGLGAVDTEWVTFLDDDDEMLPKHLSAMSKVAEVGADIVYSHYMVIGPSGFQESERDPFPHQLKADFDETTQPTICCLWRREWLDKVGGFPTTVGGVDQANNMIGEDYQAVHAAARMGAVVRSTHLRTWRWHHHGANLSGRSWRT